MITMKMSRSSDDDNANNTNDDEFNNNTKSDDIDDNVEVNDDKNAKSTTHTG